MLTELSLDPLLDQEFEGRHQAERVLNTEVSYVRYLIGWIAKMFDYINRIKLTLPLLVYEGTWTHSPPLVAMHLLDRSCMIVGKFFEILRSPIERLRDPTDQVPNVRHLRVQHTFSLMTSHELLIQLSFTGEFRQHDGVVMEMMKLPA